MFTTGLMILFFLPPVGFVLYLLFGQNYARQRMFVIEKRVLLREERHDGNGCRKIRRAGEPGRALSLLHGLDRSGFPVPAPAIRSRHASGSLHQQSDHLVDDIYWISWGSIADFG